MSTILRSKQVLHYFGEKCEKIEANERKDFLNIKEPGLDDFESFYLVFTKSKSLKTSKQISNLGHYQENNGI